MAKTIKLVDPKEIQAARDYVDLKKKFHEHIAHVQQKQKKELEQLGVEFSKRFRELYARFGHKHMADPEASFANNEYYLLHDYLEGHGDVYLARQEDWNAAEPPAVPTDHSELFQDKTIH